MFSHVTIGSRDPAKAAQFYDEVFACLGIQPLFKLEQVLAYGEPAGAKTFVVKPFDGDPHAPGNGWHAAYRADTRAQVDAFHAKALERGGSCEGKPGLRPHYHPNYYGAYVRDPEGNKLQAVCHSKNG